MKGLIKILSLMLAVSVSLLALGSCDLFSADAESVIAEAEAVLDGAPYTVDMRIIFETEHEELSEALQKFSDPRMKLSVDGDDFKARMLLGFGDDDNYIDYIYVGGVLYEEISESGKTVNNEFVLEDLTDEELVEQLGVGVALDHTDFESVKAINSDGKTVVRCEDIKDAPLAALIESLEDELGLDGCSVAVKDAALAIEIVDGRYSVTLLECDYVITTEEDVYTLRMRFGTKFYYDEEVNITAPIK